MKRWMLTCVWLLLVSTVLRADVTITQTMTIEGPAAAMMGNNAPPRVVMRIKGTKARSEAEMMGQSAVFLSDLASKQIILLNAADKTARLVDVANPAIPPGTALPETTDMTFKATGQKRTIDGQICDEYAIAMTLDMAGMARPGSNAPPEAAQMLQGIKIVVSGSTWLSHTGPGAAEFIAYQKAAVAVNMAATVAAVMGGASSGIDKIFAASAGAQGLPYLTEVTMTIDGTGDFAQFVRQQFGAVRMTQKVTAISTDPLTDSLFSVPADYTMVKQEPR